MNTRRELTSLLARFDLVSKQVESEQTALDKALERVSNVSQAQSIVQEIAERVQTIAHQQISSVITRCLEAVFGESAYQFKIRFDRKRGKTEARLLLIRGELEIEDPLDEAGGGIVDISALALRLSVLSRSRPRRRPLLIGDEMFKNVNGEENQSRVGELLETIVEEMDLQLIQVTDDEWLKIGKVVEL